MKPRPILNLLGDRLHALPLLVVYLADGCNSKCATCDIWKLPRRNMSLALAEQLADECATLGVQEVLLSGGEPTQHPEWPQIAALFRQAGARVLLLTNGLLLKRQIDDVVKHVSEVTVSLDSATAERYATIRGVDGFDMVLEGIIAADAHGVPVTTRTTVQQANYYQMPDIVRLGRDVGVQRVSFVGVDVKSKVAFGPRKLVEAPHGDGGSESPNGHNPPTHTLTLADLAEFDAVLDTMEIEFASEFRDGFIAESPADLRRMRNSFAALQEGKPLIHPSCNAPHTSAVVEVDGRLRSCFFLPVTGTLQPGDTIQERLNEREAIAMRRAYRRGQRPECAGCVSPIYRSPRSLLKGDRSTLVPLHDSRVAPATDTTSTSGSESRGPGLD